MADFSFSEDAELQELNQNVINDPENFESWDKLVRAAEQQEGGLHRNSSPSAIAATRDVYDRLLARFPLFFGYWKKYADLEFTIAGTEAADMVYERGVASIPISVDLWANYCAFKTDTCHESDLVRGLFERGAEAVGLDFMSDRFWDKYIEWEERNENPVAVYNLYQRLIHIPLHQYNRYFDMAGRVEDKLPLTSFLTQEQLVSLQQAVQSEKGDNISPYETEQLIRAKLKEARVSQHARIASDVNSRWEYEGEIKRPYYHVTDLDDAQITNWHKYLDFEEAVGNYERTKFLYERALVAAANYPMFWLRYVHWMSSQDPSREEEVRNIYQRASCTFVAIAEPQIRRMYAAFEEAMGRLSVAIEIHEAILMNLPYDVDTIESLAKTYLRHYGLKAAANIVLRYMKDSGAPVSVRGELIDFLAVLTYQNTADAAAASEVYRANKSFCAESQAFWSSWLCFEIRLPCTTDQSSARDQVITALHDEIRFRSPLVAADRRSITIFYMQYLQKRGGKDAMKEWLQLDLEVNGYGSTGKAKAPLLANDNFPHKSGMPVQ